jgi:hypothetical protein
VTATCAPASNQVFKVGTPPVKCTATDDAGNQAERSFNVTVELLTYGPNGNPIPARGSSQTRATRARNDVPATVPCHCWRQATD